jgi:hypothetical protein
VTHRRRRSWARTAIGSAALAGATLLAIQGCAPGTSATTDASTGHGPSYAQAMTQARSAFTSYVSVSTATAASGARAKALGVVANAQWAEVKAQYEALASTGTPVPRYRYGTPRFDLPAPDGYLQWFMVTVPRSAETGGQLGAVVDTVMVFSRAAAHLPFTLDGTFGIDKPLPPLAYDSDGYAVSEPEVDAGMLLPPDVVGPSQAAVADEGPRNPAAAVIAAGPQSTGLYAAQAAQGRAEHARGLAYQWLLEGAPFPQFQLRLRSGADLVLYGMYLNTTLEHPNLTIGSPLPVPAGFSPLFAAPTEVGYHEVLANWTYQFAAIDPPATAHGAKVTVIAAYGAPSYGHAY